MKGEPVEPQGPASRSGRESKGPVQALIKTKLFFLKLFLFSLEFFQKMYTSVTIKIYFDALERETCEAAGAGFAIGPR
ncbi:MAG: hypothetical protein O7D30_12715, partial [Rickettsia endosymbiont of Ixodes persulcatus]|nr:hypothetical protein [Rickettsia endosymbiont of Ixodes persulcatus]